MPKSPMQKSKLLYIKQYLETHSDEDHAVPIEELISFLDSKGIRAERKSLYDDFEQLKLFGVDILSVRKNRTVGYYLASRTFEVSELKLLVDAVQGSRFITQKKSAELIRKLGTLCSNYENAALSRQVLLSNRIKSMNESIYYNVDKIHTAINTDKAITFTYFEYNRKKERVLRHNGKKYNVSPFALNWDDENYYLIGFDNELEQIRHYRVDKMLEIDIMSTVRKGKDVFSSIDVEKYAGKVFSMFGGKQERVCMEFDNSLCSAVIDRFGKDVLMHDSKNEGKFYVHSDIVVSDHFFGWLFSFGNKAKVVTPQNVVTQFLSYTKNAIFCPILHINFRCRGYL